GSEHEGHDPPIGAPGARDARRLAPITDPARDAAPEPRHGVALRGRQRGQAVRIVVPTEGLVAVPAPPEEALEEARHQRDGEQNEGANSCRQHSSVPRRLPGLAGGGFGGKPSARLAYHLQNRHGEERHVTPRCYAPPLLLRT